jgi:hypothetical protein
VDNRKNTPPVGRSVSQLLQVADSSGKKTPQPVENFLGKRNPWEGAKQEFLFNPDLGFGPKFGPYMGVSKPNN